MTDNHSAPRLGKRICLMEADAGLSERLTDYLSGHSGQDYRFFCYSSTEQLPPDMDRSPFDLYLIDREFEKERGFTRPRGKTIWLTRDAEDREGYFLYQSAESLLHLLENHFLLGGRQSTGHSSGLISLYSPIRRAGQSLFGLCLSQILAERGRTLYMNLESYSGLERIISYHYTKDIFDFLYSYTSKSTDFEHIPDYIYPIGQADMLAPALLPENLMMIPAETWLDFLTGLTKAGLYEYVILDIGDGIRGIPDILLASTSIFSMYRKDEGAAQKWRQYSEMINGTGRSRILDKTVLCDIPYIKDLSCEAAMDPSGEMAAYVRKQIKEADLL